MLQDLLDLIASRARGVTATAGGGNGGLSYPYMDGWMDGWIDGWMNG